MSAAPSLYGIFRIILQNRGSTQEACDLSVPAQLKPGPGGSDVDIEVFLGVYL